MHQPPEAARGRGLYSLPGHYIHDRDDYLDTKMPFERPRWTFRGAL